MPPFQIKLQWSLCKMAGRRGCQDNFIEIYEKTTALVDRNKQICGDEARDMIYNSNHLYLRAYASRPQFMPTFKVMFTVFTYGTYYAMCRYM